MHVTHFLQGAQIIQLMARHMPAELFKEITPRGAVGLFTSTDKTTIFPEYEIYRDTPQCAGLLKIPTFYFKFIVRIFYLPRVREKITIVV